MTIFDSLSLAQARKVVLLSQNVHNQGLSGGGEKAVLKAVEQLGYIQIDTISVVERAHHHTLWNRVKTYQPAQLASLVDQKKVFEYWSHAAAYLPMRDYRYSLPRKHAIACGEKHWHQKDLKITQMVLQRITQQGPLQAKDFQHSGRVKGSGWWDWKPAKRALEQLFMEGDLMVVKRRGFQKVYDLTERVLPAGLDTSMPNTDEVCDHLIIRFLTANGLGSPAQIAYLRRGMKPLIQKRCCEMLENGQLIQLTVNQRDYFALPEIEHDLTRRLSRSAVKILSPFDNLLIQRKRTYELFGFDYQIECYLPAKKRQYGYFSLPLLWGQSFAGRLDAKIDRKTGVLNVLNLNLETSKPVPFCRALAPVLATFLAFNHGREINLLNVSDSQHTSNAKLKIELNKCLRNFL